MCFRRFPRLGRSSLLRGWALACCSWSGFRFLLCAAMVLHTFKDPFTSTSRANKISENHGAQSCSLSSQPSLLQRPQYPACSTKMPLDRFGRGISCTTACSLLVLCLQQELCLLHTYFRLATGYQRSGATRDITRPVCLSATTRSDSSSGGSSSRYCARQDSSTVAGQKPASDAFSAGRLDCIRSLAFTLYVLDHGQSLCFS